MENIAKSVLEKHLDDFISASRNPGAANTGSLGLALASIFRELKSNPVLVAEIERMQQASGGQQEGADELAALERELLNM